MSHAISKQVSVKNMIMFREDEVIASLEEVLSNDSGFFRNGIFQVNGNTSSCSIEQGRLDRSDFSFDYHGKSILHFTSLNSLRMILDSRVLRASNLNSFDDELELLHAVELGGHDPMLIAKEKASKFALSFTRRDKPIEEMDYHWINYANNFRGAALEFEIESYRLPSNIFSLNINYVKQASESSLLRKISKMDLKPAVLKALIPVLSAIKDSSFKDEAEVRIFVDGNENVIEMSHWINDANYTFSLDEENNVSYFYQFPILVGDDESSYDKFLRLKAIYLGAKSMANFGTNFENWHLCKFCGQNKIKLKNLRWK